MLISIPESVARLLEQRAAEQGRSAQSLAREAIREKIGLVPGQPADKAERVG